MSVPSISNIIDAFIQIDEKRLAQGGELSPGDYAYWISLKHFIEEYIEKSKKGDFSAFERRNSIRVPSFLRIEYKTTEQFNHAYLSNFSEGGVSIECNFPINTGTELSLNIYLNDDEIIPVEGRVVWLSQQQGKENRWRVGIKFINVSKEIKQKIAVQVHTTLKGMKD